MKKLFLIRDSLANKICYYHLILLMGSLPFDMFYSHIIMISLIINLLIQFKGQPVRLVLSWRTAALVSVFLVTVWSTFYSVNKANAYSEWGKQITILLFPLIFYYLPLDLKKYRDALLLIFSMVCTAVVAYLFLNAFYSIRFYGFPLSSILSSYFTNHNFSEPVGMHATFLSMQLAVALVYLLSLFIKERSRNYRLLLSGCMGMLSAGLLQLSSKSVCFCLFFIILLAVPYFLLQRGVWLKFILIAGSLFIIPVALILKQDNLKKRYVKELETDLSDAENGEAEDPRIARWGAVTELIAASPVIGYGAGTEIPLLQNAFFEKKFYSSYIHRLNSHSEYLSLLLKSGITGLLAYLATLVYGIRLSIKRKDIHLFLFMALIVFVSVSENLLDVDKGIIFYAFFFSFFLFSADEKRPVPATG